MSEGSSSAQTESFRKALHDAKSIVILSGAGLSAASGVPTFRSNGGLWRNYDIEKVGTPKAFSENQSRVWQFYHWRRELVRKTVPNQAHYALAKLCIPRFRRKISPDSECAHITQNIDELSSKAIDEVISSEMGDNAPANEVDKAKVIEMHGRLFDVKCTAHDCDYVAANYDSPICEGLAGTEVDVASGSLEHPVKRSDLPHCPKCGQLLRPRVVWFYERPFHVEEVMELAEKADFCIIVGTSLKVRPANTVGKTVKGNGGKVAIFNVERCEGDDIADFLFLGPCETFLPETLLL